MIKNLRLTAEELIIHNKKVHDLAAPYYEARHREIYNPTEQRRIRNVLQQTIAQIRTGASTPLAMDFGAGTGNLTKHLLDLKTKVVAADLSAGCLEQLTSKLNNSGTIQPVLLNGENLSNFEDNSLDMVATYSVLHHIPDYLSIVEEFMRVVKPGGVIYIDHEVCPSYWELNVLYQCYLEALGGTFREDHLSELGIPDDKHRREMYGFKKVSRAVFQRTQSLVMWIMHQENQSVDEGDIHVYKHDHIEWEYIKAKLTPSFDILSERDYLVCRETTDTPIIWTQWQDKCVDMRMLVVRKR